MNAEKATAKARASTAIHEAGHFVVARQFGLDPMRLRLDPIGGGVCEHMPLPRTRSRNDLEPLRTNLAVAVAGRVAEQLSMGIDPLFAAAPPAEIAKRILDVERAPHTHATKTRAPDTRRWAIDKLTDLYRDEAFAYEMLDEVLGPDALRRATRILRTRWDEVVELAERLEAEGELIL